MGLTDFTQKENTLLLIRADDLRAFAQELINGIKDKEPAPAQPETEKPLSQADAIEFIGKSRQTLHKWRKEGIITAHTLGGRVYYFKSELLEAMKRG